MYLHIVQGKLASSELLATLLSVPKLSSLELVIAIV